ncbi:MAG: hypothetical protein KDD43_02825, partial [Bdellovibrionales bacterium]|nr:hypothetical protein [Bdellovibrionales bacterium]
GDYAGEVNAAKKQFFESAGVFDEESSDFEQKMTQFMDWFLFFFLFGGQGVSPIKSVKAGRVSLKLNSY